MYRSGVPRPCLALELTPPVAPPCCVVEMPTPAVLTLGCPTTTQKAAIQTWLLTMNLAVCIKRSVLSSHGTDSVPLDIGFQPLTWSLALQPTRIYLARSLTDPKHFALGLVGHRWGSKWDPFPWAFHPFGCLSRARAEYCGNRLRKSRTSTAPIVVSYSCRRATARAYSSLVTLRGRRFDGLDFPVNF